MDGVVQLIHFSVLVSTLKLLHLSQNISIILDSDAAYCLLIECLIF